ncbi:class I SAM-dependent DNA methyltransferase [Streptomyces sp. AN091965]|uniref:class I SAM-dependent DNA methyltransferase n=1 Tax=Streptomyces sp. AN091965 TaxID=2927803 RepID=UPI001F60BFDD|nr:class I SAM-dependent methyltransferase [Streptomyces sp. AN091965]MCI3934613.1 methyltransferase domain-containing protein [Streptomyces sp. AN091965]
MADHGDHAAVRHSYDTVAEEYASRLYDELDAKPLDRALLACLVERTEPGAPIADLGCGPGHVASHLVGLGARAVGIDLSPGMVAEARRRHPGVEFREGDLLSLPAENGEFGSAAALYTVIHLTPDELLPAFVEARRVLRPCGLLLVSFHLGTEVRHLDEWWGHDVDLDFRFLVTDDVTALLEQAGFTVDMRMERAPGPDEAPTHRAYVLARRA